MKPLRDAGLSALVALGLFGPMVGLRTAAGPTSLVLIPRPLLVAGIVGLVFGLRLGWLLWRGRSRRSASAANPRLAAWRGG